MDWIVSALLAAIAEIIQSVIKLFAVNFLTNFGINIGGTFPTIDHPDSPTLSETISSFHDVLEGNLKSDSLSFFDMVFSGTRVFAKMIVVTAILVVVLLIAVNLIKSIIAPLTDAEHPVSVVTRGAIAGVCVLMSYRIMLTFEYVANLLYLAFEKTAFSKAVLQGTVDPDKFLHGKATAASVLSKNIDSIFMINEDSSLVGKALKGAAHGVAEAASTLIMLFLMLMLLLCFFKLLMEIVERYILLGVMFYTAPLAFIGVVSKNGMQVFRSWVRMIFSQFILMISASFFINVFIGAMNMFGAFAGKHPDITTYFVFIFALIAWLDIGVRLDQYLASLGLNAAQCGGNLWDAAAGAFGLMVSTFKLGAKNAGHLKGKPGNKGKTGGENPSDPSKTNNGNGEVPAGNSNQSSSRDAAGGGKNGHPLDSVKDNKPSSGDTAKNGAVALANKAGMNGAAISGMSSDSVKVGNGSVNIDTADGGRVVIAPMSKLGKNGNYIGKVPGMNGSGKSGVGHAFGGKQQAPTGTNKSNYSDATNKGAGKGDGATAGAAGAAAAGNGGNGFSATGETTQLGEGQAAFGGDVNTGSSSAAVSGAGADGNASSSAVAGAAGAAATGAAGAASSGSSGASASAGSSSGSSSASSSGSSAPFKSAYSMSDIANNGTFEYGKTGYGIAYENGSGTAAEDLARSIAGSSYADGGDAFEPEAGAAVQGSVSYDPGSDSLIGQGADGKTYHYYDASSIDYAAYGTANDAKIVKGQKPSPSGYGYRQYIESETPLKRIEPRSAKSMPSMGSLGLDEHIDFRREAAQKAKKVKVN